MRERKYLCVEEPDNKVTVDFLGTNSNKKKDRRACIVELTVEDGKLHVYARGCDDRATTLLDEEVELPEEDKRR